MATDSEAIVFVVAGHSLPSGQTSSSISNGKVKSAAKVAARRAGGDTVRLVAQPDEDIVLLHIANGPTLYLHPEDAQELLRAQQPISSTRGAEVTDGKEVLVPAQLGWQGLENPAAPASARGKVLDALGGVVLDAVEVVTGLFKDKAVDIATAAVTQKMDGQVDPGVYQLQPDQLVSLKGGGHKLTSVPAPSQPGDPLLVLLHGTFSNTAGTFSKLWSQHPARVRALFRRYDNRVYALDHETLGVSPFGNALMLVKALPQGARLHLMTHSRGGIVGEVLARICGGRGLEDTDLALFANGKYQLHLDELRALASEIRKKKIKVDRMVRVACPARGTLLASRRLDAYLSVLKWGMELAGLPVIPALVEFLAEVAHRRTEPQELPGLEAMMPDSAATKWLNAPAEPIEGELRVVAGDIEGDSVLTWLKTLLSDAFYWTDNDLVVQTRSMYGGTPRMDGAATFILDRGGKVTHFAYFSNERTAALVTSALIDAQPDQFRPIGPLSWAGEDASGTRAARAIERSKAASAAERPAVFVLPGILGSHLKVDGKRIWLSLRFISGLEKLRWNEDSDRNIAADGPIGMSYDDFIEHLADTHEVIAFSFDWRRPMEAEAIRLADEVDKALAARHATQRPVRIVAHSMGGLVVRTMQLERPETWKRFAARAGARFLMLGTPNGGSYAPMQVLSGDDSFGNLFTTWGGLFDGLGARELIAGMPGLLQLQAGLLDSPFHLGTEAGWQKLQEADLAEINLRVAQRSFWHKDQAQIKALRWGLPKQAVLNRAVELRKRLDEQRNSFGNDGVTLLVVGKAKATPAAVEIGEKNKGVVYLDTADGDGRVTLENAMLPGVKTWQVDIVHGDMADEKKAFDAYVDLLSNGDTARLQPVQSRAMRGASGEVPAPALVPSRPSRSMRSAEPPISMRDVLAREPDRGIGTSPVGHRLNVVIVNGNLKFVREPLIVGHYRTLKLTSTEAIIDKLLDNKMDESLRNGFYPSEVGASLVFANSRRNNANPFALPCPKAAIVVGLGEEGALTMSELIATIRQGALAYAQRLVEEATVDATFELASTLIGSGGAAISPATAAQAVALGVREANLLLQRVGWPVVSRLNLIELYTDRATEAINALNALGGSLAQEIVVDPYIVMGLGGLPRPLDAGYRGSSDNFISIQTRRLSDNSTEFDFTLSTRRARDEMRGSKQQSALLDQLVSAGSTDINSDSGIGRALFKLMVPIEIEPFLAGATSLLLQLDETAAAYPWEMLDVECNDTDRARSGRPWGIQSRLLRKLRTGNYRPNPRTADSNTDALVIGEPLCSPDKYPPLPGAYAEASEVAGVVRSKLLLQASAEEITKAVLNGTFAILHVAGHGDFDKKIGGIVLSNDTMFGPSAVQAMRIVPQLAFINCCHLGKFADPSKPPRRLAGGHPKFAANVAEQLIKIGVRCVVAAGWAVDDSAARVFARTFYHALTHGRRFIDAVAEARSVTYEQFPNSNTWAAYQCYGDPDWTYHGATAATLPRSIPEPVSADAVKLQLQTFITEHEFNGLESGDLRERVDYLASVARGRWDNQGDVATAFGAAYGEICEWSLAIDWYTRALLADDGGAALKSMEQLGNMRARHGEDKDNLQEIKEAIALLTQVCNIGMNFERESLLGSAHWGLASIERTPTGRNEALRTALDHYQKAEAIAVETANGNRFYPVLNAMAIELLLGSSRTSFDAGKVREVRATLLHRRNNNPDFWSAIGPIQLALYESLERGNFADALQEILSELENITRRAQSSRKWQSVSRWLNPILNWYLNTPRLPVDERQAARTLLDALPGGKVFEQEAGAATAPAAEPSGKKAAGAPRLRKTATKARGRSRRKQR